MTGTPSRTATAGTARNRGEEAVSKALARGTRTAYEATTEDEGANTPEVQKSLSAVGRICGGWMGRTSRVLPQDPCTSAL